MPVSFNAKLGAVSGLVAFALYRRSLIKRTFLSMLWEYIKALWRYSVWLLTGTGLALALSLGPILLGKQPAPLIGLLVLVGAILGAGFFAWRQERRTVVELTAKVPQHALERLAELCSRAPTIVHAMKTQAFQVWRAENDAWVEETEQFLQGGFSKTEALRFQYPERIGTTVYVKNVECNTAINTTLRRMEVLREILAAKGA